MSLKGAIARYVGLVCRSGKFLNIRIIYCDLLRAVYKEKSLINIELFYLI